MHCYSAVCTVGRWDSRPPGYRLDGQALAEEGPKAGKGESCKVTAVFYCRRLRCKRETGSALRARPRKLPRGPHPLGALLGLLLYLHQVGKVTWLRPYIQPERASGDVLEALPGGQEPKGTTGGSAVVPSSGVSFQGVLGNNPQKLARQTQGLCLSVTLENRFQAVWLLLLPSKPPQEDR